MANTRSILSLFSTALGPGLALIAILAISTYALLGPTGILAWSEYNAKLDKQKAELAQLEEQRAALRNRVELLNGDQDDGDLKGELIRKELGLAAPGEIIVPLR